ncbi:MAG: DUF1232 domain-containing protein [Pseudonocardiaceae bacterium]|nr:DUF1232 domain-containing protein [Pseudonocardiaceae bacterium]
MARVVTGRRFGAFRALWRAVRRGRRPGSPALRERAAALPRLVRRAVRGRYPGLGGGRLALFALGLVYLVSPVDVVPEIALTLLGLGDDAVVALWLAGSFLDETDRYLQWEHTGGDSRLEEP